MAGLDYERGLETLQQMVQRIRQEVPQAFNDFSLLKGRLLEYITREKRYGQSSDNDAGRAEVVDQLITFTDQLFALSFVDLCRSTDASSASDASDLDVAISHRPPAYELWERGSELVLQGARYTIYEPRQVSFAADRSCFYQRAYARQKGTNRPVWLKQVQLQQATATSADWKTAIEKEGNLLTVLEQEPQRFPASLAFEQNYYSATLVHTAVQGQSWTQTFGLAGTPLRTPLVRILFSSLPSLCKMLNVLHSKQLAHRALTPETILLLHGRYALLQDLGLAAWRATPDEGPAEYRAPEQSLLSRSLARPGPATDIYQLGAILYRIVGGRLFVSGMPYLPLHTLNEELPPQLDTVLQKALATNVKDRWRNIALFSSALRDVRF